MYRKWRVWGRTMPRAIIDIGSNSIRLVIFEAPARAPRPVFNEKCTAKLGKGVAESGAITPKAQDAALAALARFARLIELRGIREVTTVATAAVRDATNGAEFLARVRALGLDPQLLSGEEEAITSAFGVIGAFSSARGVVADLGGGSVELVHVQDGRGEHGTSLKLGTLVLAAMRAKDTGGLAAHVSATLAASGWSCPPGEELYLVGGTYRALARIAMAMTGWPLEDPHGFSLGGEEAVRLCTAMAEGQLPREVIGISSSRLGSIPDAALLLKELLALIRPSRVVFSSWGLREGLVYRSLPATEQEQDPLLAGVIGFVAPMGVTAASGAMVAGWTTDAVTGAAPDRANLRMAAILLALALQQVEPNLRARTALDWTLGKRWVGITGEERALLAAAVLASAGRPAVPDTLLALASAEDIGRAIVWGQAVRLCRRFSDASPQALACSWLAALETRLELHVEPPCAALVTDVVTRDLATLAERLALEPVVVRA